MFGEYMKSLCMQSSIVGCASLLVAIFCLLKKHYVNVLVVLLSGFANFTILNCLCMSKCFNIAWFLVVINLMHLGVYSGLLKLDEDNMKV